MKNLLHTFLVFVGCCLHSLPLAAQVDAGVTIQRPGQHLFILSGQSNMTGGLVTGFSRKAEDAFGKENVTIAMSGKSGRGLRFWCSDFRYPDNRKLGEQERIDNGSLYEPLINAVGTAVGEKVFGTVTFIWMQGESDANRGWSEVYAENFIRLLNRLKADLKRENIRFVIGRLSDHDMQNQKFSHWTKMRDAQVTLAEGHSGGAWIDTDDLNDGEGSSPGGDLHYGREESVMLGERFADRAIRMIKEPHESNKPSK